MHVQAIAKGNYNGLRKVGDTFVLVEREDADGETITTAQQFSKKWMVELDADGNPVKGTSKDKVEKLKRVEEPVKNAAEKSTPSKNDNGTDIDVLKDRLADADKADDKGLDDGKAADGAAPATRRVRKAAAEKPADEKPAAEASEDADDKGDDTGSADDADGTDKAPAEEGTRRRRRRG